MAFDRDSQTLLFCRLGQSFEVPHDTFEVCVVAILVLLLAGPHPYQIGSEFIGDCEVPVQRFVEVVTARAQVRPVDRDGYPAGRRDRGDLSTPFGCPRSEVVFPPDFDAIDLQLSREFDDRLDGTRLRRDRTDSELHRTPQRPVPM